MSRFLSQLLGAQEPLFTTNLRQLDAMTGQQGIDIAVIVGATQRGHAMMRKIGLDPADTTPLELYRALIAHVEDGALFVDMDDVALMFGGMVISFNNDDVRENMTKTFELRTVEHARRAISRTLAVRYRHAAGAARASVDEIIKTMHLEDDSEESVTTEPSGAATLAPYILCVGDIFTDTFIKLLDSEARIDTDADGSKRLSMPFGNKPPYERADVVPSVGPSPNAAVSCARLGLRVGLMSWIGDDQVGKDSIKYLVGEKIDVTPIVTQANTASNSYYVLRYGADRTILVKNEQYDYRWQTPTTKPDWIYLSLISADSWHLHQDMLAYLYENPEVKLAFQPGTFHFKWGAEKLAEVYGRSHIVVMNREEAVDVTGRSYDSLRDLADGLHQLGSKIVVITDGPNGSFASYDGKLYRIPNYPDPAPPLDRTGAGDAFASTIVAALALGKPIEEALSWAPINSMNVVQKLGAQAGLLQRHEISEYLENAPENYRTEEIAE